MAILKRDLCSTHMRRLSAIPFFHTVAAQTFTDWITEAMKCDDTAHLIRTVDYLLALKALPQTPDDIATAVAATRDHAASEHRTDGGFCDLCRNGQPPGWIREMRIVRGNEYSFAGRCKCQPGGWV